MKKLTLALTALLTALALTACLSLGPQTDDASAREAALDPLTGELARWPDQRPAAVFVHNGMDAERQWGIGEASVVLEALTEGDSATSLCLVYPSLEAVPKTGPVAQARDLYLQLLVCQSRLRNSECFALCNDTFLNALIESVVLGTNDESKLQLGQVFGLSCRVSCLICRCVLSRFLCGISGLFCGFCCCVCGLSVASAAACGQGNNHCCCKQGSQNFLFHLFHPPR